MKLDRTDRRILEQMQVNGRITNLELADAVGLSATPCSRRVKRLEEDGFVRKRVALLSEEALGLGVTVFVAIKTNAHNEEWLTTFAEGVRALPEVVEFYRLSGETDYMLKVVAKDIQDFDRVYKQLISIAPMHDVSSSFAMERIKSSTALPLNHLQ